MTRRPLDPAIRTLDQELALVREAIEYVTGAPGRRMVVAGLRFGEDLIEPARRLAGPRHLRIVPLWTIDEQGADLAVEWATDEPARLGNERHDG